MHAKLVTFCTSGTARAGERENPETMNDATGKLEQVKNFNNVDLI